MRKGRGLGIAAALALTAAGALAEADGPDWFRVTGVADGESLTLRAAPGPEAEILGALPPGAAGLRNLGCRGGMSYAEWAEASAAERAAAARERWCRVGWRGLEGWVAARFLAEGAPPGAGAPPAAPAQGGPRRWEVVGVSTALDLRAGPGRSAEIVARLAPGAVLSNLGCRAAGGRVWCDVQPMEGGPRGWAAADWLAPARGPDGAVPMGEDDSALRAGRGDFDAAGEIPCAGPGGGPMRACRFGVARGTGGDATLVVTRPDGGRRAIFFVHGRAVGADLSEADRPGRFSARREGHATLVKIGPERYEIPDAVPLGG